MLFLGIDPGLSGAIAVIDHDGEFLDVRDLPTVDLPGGGSVTRRLEGAQLVKLIRTVVPPEFEAVCYVEDVQVWVPGGRVGRKPAAGDEEQQSGPGASTMAAMLATKMVILAVLDCFASRITVETVQPRVWKSHFGLKKVKDPALTKSKIATLFKAASRARAVALFPTAGIRQAQHDGRAEALLLARYARDRWMTANGLWSVPSSPIEPLTVKTPKQLLNDEIDARIPFAEVAR